MTLESQPILMDIQVKEAKLRLAKCWADIAAKLPVDFNPHYNNFARTYFRVQLRISRGQKRRASEIMRGLVERTGYKEFEENNMPLLAAIDIAVKGSSSWQDNLKNPIRPLFTLNGGASS